jgi:hypothetical protein
MEIVKSKMANALTSDDQNHVIAVAADVFDENQQKYQEALNQEFDTRLDNIERGTSGGGEPFSGSAADVTYDNSKSNISPTNVQGAIDYLVIQIKSLTSKVTELEEIIQGGGVVDNPITDLGGASLPDDYTVVDLGGATISTDSVITDLGGAYINN